MEGSGIAYREQTSQGRTHEAGIVEGGLPWGGGIRRWPRRHRP